MSEVITMEALLRIGGYSNEMQAKQEAKEFARPEVFTSRSAVFPNPFNFKIKVEPVKAEAKAYEKSSHPHNTHYVELHIKLMGEQRKVDDWLKRVRSSLRANDPVALDETGEREEHLRDTGKAHFRVGSKKA